MPWSVHLPSVLADESSDVWEQYDPDLLQESTPVELGHPLGLRRLRNPDDFERLFGEITPAEPDAHCEFIDADFEREWIDTFRLVGDQSTIRFRSHRAIGDTLTAAWRRIAAASLHYGIDYEFRTVGCYNSRYQKTAPAVRANPQSPWYGLDCKYRDANTYRLSVHAWGAALDINASTNRQGSGRGDIPTIYINILERAGFLWGGRFRGGENDPMHFEWASLEMFAPL